MVPTNESESHIAIAHWVGWLLVRVPVIYLGFMFIEKGRWRNSYLTFRLCITLVLVLFMLNVCAWHSFGREGVCVCMCACGVSPGKVVQHRYISSILCFVTWFAACLSGWIVAVSVVWSFGRWVAVPPGLSHFLNENSWASFFNDKRTHFAYVNNKWAFYWILVCGVERSYT